MSFHHTAASSEGRNTIVATSVKRCQELKSILEEADPLIATYDQHAGDSD